jgi:hypothetical protein
VIPNLADAEAHRTRAMIPAAVTIFTQLSNGDGRFRPTILTRG